MSGNIPTFIDASIAWMIHGKLPVISDRDVVKDTWIVGEGISSDKVEALLPHLPVGLPKPEAVMPALPYGVEREGGGGLVIITDRDRLEAAALAAKYGPYGEYD